MKDLKGRGGWVGRRRANSWLRREYSVPILRTQHSVLRAAQPGGKGMGPSGCLPTDLLIKHQKAIVLC